MPNNTNVFSVIVTYNGIRWIKKCLESIIDQCQVIVIDNNSQDDTVELIKNEFPEVQLLEQSKNLGFGKANNLGISIAMQKGADYVFLLNQDAYVDAAAIEKLSHFANSNKDYGIICPIHCNWEATHLERSFSEYINYANNKDFYSDYVLQKPIKTVYDVPFVAAAAWLITKECINRIGGFDPIFFHLGEDANYCQRVLYHGLKIGVLPEVRIYHDTMNRIYPHLEKYSEQYFFKKSYHNKAKYADINLKQIEKKIHYQKKQLLKSIVLAAVKLNKFNFLGALKEYRQFSQQMRESLISREKNVITGKHYLDL
ncbi:glycosyltransferase [Flavobacteriaceae bacterium R38]|nr:glycosyltransferase [Flavobacteriaceae bacterium R38]